MAEPLDKLTEGFTAIIDSHLTRLGFGGRNRARAEIHRMTGIAQSQIGDWYNGKSLPGRDRINEICFAFAREYQVQRQKEGKFERERIGPKTLDGMLNEMLEAVGYRPIVGTQSRRDEIWTRLATDSNRQLKIAWVHYPPFAYLDSNGRHRGVAIEIMARVAKLMGATPIWEERQWSTLISSLVSGEVDVIAALLLELPSRMFQVAFSSQIPDVKIGISGLVNSAYLSETVTAGYCLNYVRGEAGEALCTMFDPNATTKREHDTFEAAYQAIEQQGEDDERRVHCLVADDVICKEREKASDRRLVTMPSLAVGVAEPHKLQIAAGIHLEEPQL